MSVIKKINNACTKLITQTTEGEVFTKQDIRNIRGVSGIYLQLYEQAQQDLLPDINTFDSSFTVTSVTEELYSIEMLYNLVVCLAVQKKFVDAISALDELVGQVSETSLGNFQVLKGFLMIAGKKVTEGLAIVEEYKTYAEELVTGYLDKTKDVLIAPFETEMPSFKLPLDNGLFLCLRPVMAIPKIKPPSFKIKPNEEILKEFNIKSCPCKPEPPWLNRRNGFVVFTEDVQDTDVDIPEDERKETPQTTSQTSDYPKKHKSAVEMYRPMSLTPESEDDE